MMEDNFQDLQLQIDNLYAVVLSLQRQIEEIWIHIIDDEV